MTTEEERTLSFEKGNRLAVGFDFVEKTTDINRRNAHRKRPMQVLALGLSRTGTVSVRAALLQLGYWDTYHMTVPMIENLRDCEMWNEAFDAKFFGKGKPFGKREFDSLLGDFMATTDVPCLHFAPELVAAYPDAKIILTVRDTPEKWVESWKATIIYYLHLHYFPTLNPWKLFVRTFATPHPVDILFDRMFRAYEVFKPEDVTADIYHNHNKLIRRLAGVPEDGSVKRTDTFLEFNVKEGWGPLCDFLGKEPPKDMPFPTGNDTKRFVDQTDYIWHVTVISALKDAGKYAVTAAVLVAGVWWGSKRL